MPTGVNTYAVSEVMCYLKPVSTGPSCLNLKNDWYCGNRIGGKPNTKYNCTNGKMEKAVDCSFTCLERTSSEGGDECVAQGSCTGLPTSYLCGNDGVGGISSALYLCKNGQPAGASYCANSCEIVPGANDKCK